jgi:hypothetical protein
VLTPPIRGALALFAASAGLAGCTNLGPYGGVGVGVGVGSSPYGYGSYGYDPYYAGHGYGSEFGYNPYGWYNGYYYPGAGYWVYDRDRNRRALTAAERAYWRARMIQHIRARRGLDGATSTAAATENWSGFKRPSAAARASTGTTDRDQARAQVRQRAIEQRAARQQAQAERQQVRSERQEIRRQAVQEQRESRRVRRGSSDD